jgi:Zn-dependent protease
LELLNLLEPNRLITMGILILTSIPIHEWAHAWSAYQLGDDTAALRGRLTLNPLAHLDPLGTFSLLFLGFGWGKPVPVSPYRLRGNRRASRALVSVAGPFSNLVMAMVAAIPFRLGWVNANLFAASSINLESILLQFIYINLGLMVFNLLPIPPLDGSRVLVWLLPGPWADAIDQLERFGGMAMMLIILLLSRVGILSMLIRPIFNFMLRALLYY